MITVLSEFLEMMDRKRAAFRKDLARSATRRLVCMNKACSGSVCFAGHNELSCM